jgi:hypothetical protein
VLEYCTKSELHLATARLGMLKGRQKFVEDLVRRPGRKTLLYRHFQGGCAFYPYSRDKNRFEHLSAKSKPLQSLTKSSRMRTRTTTKDEDDWRRYAVMLT